MLPTRTGCLLLFALQASLLVGCAKPALEVEPGGDGVELLTLDFDQLEKLIASHAGQVVVLDCWSTSCAPCLREFPHLVALQKKYGPRKLACISLSFDYEGEGKPEEQVPRVLAFLRRQKAGFENVLSSEDSDTLRRKLKLTSIPAVFVYGTDGQLVKRFDNDNAATEAEEFTYRDVETLVAQLLGKREPAEKRPAESPASSAAEQR